MLGHLPPSLYYLFQRIFLQKAIEKYDILSDRYNAKISKIKEMGHLHLCFFFGTVVCCIK